MIFPVTGRKNEQLQQAMERLGIRESDFQESFVRSGGPGGQNVNKVSTCVVLKHLPTGLMIKCQKERSQALNRYRARQLLIAKIEAEKLGRESAEVKRIAKIKRQKRKRSRRAKEKMLAIKHRHAEKKQYRKPVFRED